MRLDSLLGLVGLTALITAVLGLACQKPEPVAVPYDSAALSVSPSDSDIAEKTVIGDLCLFDRPFLDIVKSIAERRASASGPENGGGSGDTVSALLQAISLDQAFAELADRKMRATRMRGLVRNRRWELWFLVADPYAGQIPVFIVVPGGLVNGRVVVAVHGHGENPLAFFFRLSFDRLVDKGYTLVMPVMGAMCADAHEDRVTRAAEDVGTSSTAIRAYVASVAAEFASRLPFIKEDRYCFIGHSNGAVIANLAVRFRPERASCLVVDHVSSFSESRPSGLFLDAHSAILSRHADYINDFENVGIPVLKTDYNFHGSSTLSGVFNFIEKSDGRVRPL